MNSSVKVNIIVDKKVYKKVFIFGQKSICSGIYPGICPGWRMSEPGYSNWSARIISFCSIVIRFRMS